MPDEEYSVSRGADRRRVEIAVTLVIEGDEAEHRATTLDLSNYGLRLRSDVTLLPGQHVGLLLSTRPDCFIKARVAWVGKSDSPQAGQAGFAFSNAVTGPVC